jgi:outer membrane lipoprotein-sorting protein
MTPRFHARPPALARSLALALALAAAPLAAAGLAATLAPAPAAAQMQLTQEDRAEIARMEATLRAIDTLESRFVQVSSDGGYAEGELWLDRPGKMRFEYDDPVPVLLIANGLELLYYDRELEQPTFVPLWETPLWLFLKEDATLTDGIEVMGIRRSQGEVELRVREADHPDRGELVLRFGREPMRLLGWTVVDPQGIATEVSLVDPRWGVQIADDRFESRHLPNVGLEGSR